jgi:hypothetical protein
MTNSCAGQTASESVEQVFNVARSALDRIADNLEKSEFRLFPDPARRDDPATGCPDDSELRSSRGPVSPIMRPDTDLHSGELTAI